MRDEIIPAGARSLLLDDILATGGAAPAGANFLEHTGADVVGMACLLEIEELDGRDALPDLPTALLLS